MNNQKAVLKVGTDDFFVTSISSTTTAVGNTTATTPNIGVQPFFSGISLDVTPNIDANGYITLHVHPSVSTVSERTKVINLGTQGSYALPLASSEINESDAVVRAHDGNIIAIGGLMRQASVNSDSGVPGTEGTFWRKLLGGQTNRLSEKRELVILLKPTIVDPSLEDADLRRDALQRLLDWTDNQPAKVTAAPSARVVAALAPPVAPPAAPPVAPPVAPPATPPQQSLALKAEPLQAAPAALPPPTPAADAPAVPTLSWAAMGAAGAVAHPAPVVRPAPAALPVAVPVAVPAVPPAPLARLAPSPSVKPAPQVPLVAPPPPARTVAQWRKPAAKEAQPAFYFVAAGAARAAAAAQAARPKVDAPWAPLAQRATLWSTPVPTQPLRAAALPPLRPQARG
jgi:hypothetical protein